MSVKHMIIVFKNRMPPGINIRHYITVTVHFSVHLPFVDFYAKRRKTQIGLPRSIFVVAGSVLDRFPESAVYHKKLVQLARGLGVCEDVQFIVR